MRKTIRTVYDSLSHIFLPPYSGSGSKSQAHPEVSYEAVRIIDALAQESACHRTLVKGGVLSPLQQLAAGTMPQTRSFAARTLVSLATTSDGRAAAAIHRHMVEAGSFEVIIGQLADSHADVAGLAAAGIEKLARTGGEPLAKVLQLGAVAALSKLAYQALDKNNARVERAVEVRAV